MKLSEAVLKELFCGENQSLNCRKCGGDMFLVAVDRGTNNCNNIMQQCGCRICENRMVVGRTVYDAIVRWHEFQECLKLPITFATPCGGNTPLFKKDN